MADAQSSTSSAEVEGYVHQPPPVQFAPPPPPPDPASVHGQHGVVNDKSSRWSARDDVLLCDALIAQKNLGRNTGTAVFSMDAWNEVAAQMKGTEILSGGAQKTVAQCKARWQRLKIEYRIVKHLRQQPGFQWDENGQIVTGLAATWDAYIVEHKDAQPWRKKSFPCYSRVAFLIEDENGHDPGDAKFKRRWAASAQSAQQQSSSKSPRSAHAQNRQAEGGEASNGAVPPAPASSTSVFSVSVPPQAAGAIPSMPFATQVVPGVAMTMPLNGGYSAIHQYRLPSMQPNGKRTETPSGDFQSASSKRPRADANATTSTNASTPQPQPQSPAQPDAYGPPAVPVQAQPFAPGQVYYTPGPPGATPVPVPGAVPPGPSAASRLALAIQSVEDSEGLSDADFVKAVQLFQRRTEAADAYLAIQSKRARTMYLRAELEDFVQS